MRWAQQLVLAAMVFISGWMFVLEAEELSRHCRKGWQNWKVAGEVIHISPGVLEE